MKKIEKGILGIVITGAVISLMVAVFISPFASSFPDGLEKVADTLGFADRAAAFADDGFFLIPDYLFKYTENQDLHQPLAGLFGVLIILVIFGTVFLIYRAVIRKKKN